MRTNAARVAAEDSRKLSRPQKPEEYKFGLSPSFKPPQGLEFKLNENDPLVGQYRNFALKTGLDQAQFTEGLDLIAAVKVGERAEFEAAASAELQKLGPAGKPRIDAIANWWTAMAGDKAKSIINVLRMAPLAETVEAMETVMQKYSSQGAASFSATGRDHDAGNGKIPGYETMSFEQRRFAQDQQNQRRVAAR